MILTVLVLYHHSAFTHLLIESLQNQYMLLTGTSCRLHSALFSLILDTFLVLYFYPAVVSRSSDGSMLVVSSSDGYCSIVHFKEGELGVPYSLSVKQVLERSSSPLPQNSDTPGNSGFCQPGKSFKKTFFSSNSRKGLK